MLIRNKEARFFNYGLVVVTLAILNIGAARCEGSVADPTEISLMTFNMLRNPDAKRLDRLEQVLRLSGADIIGLQEAYHGETEVFAKKLGFDWDASGKILSRYPIARRLPDAFGVVVKWGDREVAVFNRHLRAFPYGPYDLRDGKDVQSVIDHEAYHIEQMQASLSEALNEKDLVILLGDFNVPSGLDWIPEVASLHFGHSINWPLSNHLLENNFKDSYRQVHPSPAEKLGYTWTPMWQGLKEVHDRIDYIYYRGRDDVRVKRSVVIGERGPHTDIAFDPWPSDHRAVLSAFSLSN